MRFLIIGPFWEQAGSAARASRTVPKNKPNRAIAIAVIHFVAFFGNVFMTFLLFQIQISNRPSGTAASAEIPETRIAKEKGLDQKRMSAEEQRTAWARRRAVILLSRLEVLQ